MARLLRLGFVCALWALLASAEVAPCVCNFDPAKDYFAASAKPTPKFAQGFTISYHKSYKLITTRAGGVSKTYAAVLCGAPVPSDLPEGSLLVTIPVARIVGVTSTTYLPYLAYLGLRDAVAFDEQDPDTMSACIRKQFDQGLVQTAIVVNGGYAMPAPQAVSAILTTRSSPLSVVLYGKYDDPNMQSSVNEAFGTSGGLAKPIAAVLMGETDEQSARAVFEWIFVVAALFNLETTALLVAESVYARYDCNSALAVDLATKASAPLKVIWGSFYKGKYMGVSCPSWQCTIVQNAGGVLVNTTQLKDINAFAADADVQSAAVWIYNDFNWNQTSHYGNPPVFVPDAFQATLNALPVVQRRRVFDFLGRHFSELFINVKAEPDVLLLDAIQAFYGDDVIPRHRVFLRNVFTESAVPQSPQPASACPDATAPLFTDWRVGPCSTSGPRVQFSFEATPLCANESDTPETTTSDTMTPIIVLGVCVGVFAAAFWTLGKMRSAEYGKFSLLS